MPTRENLPSVQRKVLTVEINACEVCGNADLDQVLDLGNHPLCDDLSAVGSSLPVEKYPIQILYCRNCRTAHQKIQIEKTVLFPASYHYRARFTADVLRGMEQLTDSCIEKFGALAGKKVLDIGCNDGSLLSFFHRQGAITLGVEPTDAANDAIDSKQHHIFKNYWNVETAQQIVKEHGTVDFITFTNVFAHISNFSEIIAALNIVKSPDTVIVIENHYLGSVLENSQFDTFYHEHPRTYSFRSFEFVAKSLGATIIDAEFPQRYGGNIRVFIAARGETHLTSATRQERDRYEAQFAEKFAELQKTAETWRDAKRQSIDALVARHGRLIAKAFPARAAILVTLLGLDETLIEAVYEKPGSMKIGHYVPGTQIPICSDDVLFGSGTLDRPLLNFAWHISAEIRKSMASRGYVGPIIDLFSPDPAEW